MNLLLPLLLALAAAAAGFLAGKMNAQRTARQNEQAAALREQALREQLAGARTRLDALGEQAALRAEADEKLNRQRQEALRSEMEAFLSRLGQQQSDAFRQTGLQQMGELLNPLGRDIRDFRDKFVSTREGLEKQIENLLRQTGAMSREADELVRALRGEQKTQGNWGEGILRNLLEASGLRENIDYELQLPLTDEDGRRRLPDCVVHLPGQKALVIDSKVSLTAYIDYVNADSEAASREALRRHLESVRAHFKELERKDYAHLVRGAVGYVLMFIPNEAAYVAAVRHDAHLVSDAYERHIILVNPTNLLMALQLALNLWQSERRKQNVEAIYQSAEALYKKFSTFAAGYTDVGRRLEQLQAAYDTSRRQLCSGRGNIISRLEQWKEKGLETAARIPDSLLEESAGEEASLPHAANGQAPEEAAEGARAAHP